MKLPSHVAIIMDGNGRWGLKNYKNRIKGHQKGVENIKPFIDFFLKKKIKNLTLYALSKDNLLKRDQKEINNIFDLLDKYLRQNNDFFIKNKIHLNFIGENRNLPKNIKILLKKTSKVTKLPKANLVLNIAFNYSSRSDIILSIKKTFKNKNNLTIKNLTKNLSTYISGDLDLVIRTGGHKRLSDFLLWESSYSEIYFCNKLWPDFNIRDLNRLLYNFSKIKRNFGS